MKKSIISTGFPITQSVVEGIQEGNIYETGDALFVLHKAGFASLINEEKCDVEELIDLFKSHNIPSYFHIYNVPDTFINKILERTDLFNTKIRKRFVLQYEGTEKLSYSVPEGYNLTPVSKTNFERLKELPLGLENKFWKGSDDFVKNALAFAIFNQAMQAVCICYSAATCNGLAEVDIWTEEKHRGKGLGKIIAAAFINQCLQLNLIPNWDCFEENIASLNTARNLGFKLISQYKLISIFKK